MNDSTPTTPTTPNTTTTPNSTAPKTEQNPTPQTNPQAVGGDQKNESKTEVVKENKEIKAS